MTRNYVSLPCLIICGLFIACEILVHGNLESYLMLYNMQSCFIFSAHPRVVDAGNALLRPIQH